MTLSAKPTEPHRMVTCPSGLKAIDLLQRESYEVDDHKLTSRQEIDAFKNKHAVDTTRQAFIDAALSRIIGTTLANIEAFAEGRPVNLLEAG